MLKRAINILIILIVMVTSLIVGKSFASDEDFSSLDIAIFGELKVEGLLIDPNGNKTGFDPSTNSYVWQIPSSGSWVDEIPGIPSVIVIGVSGTPPGTYIFQIIGTDQRIYGISIHARDSSGATYKLKYIGLTSQGRISTYKIIYDPTPGIAPLMEKIVTISDAKNDVNIAYDLGLITNAGIEQSLIAKLNAAEKAINKGKKQTAENQLNAFINEVNAQKDKHIKENAIKILIEDAEYLINHL